MTRITIRLADETRERLEKELDEWRKVRGPKFSLNNLCEEKLSAQVVVTGWPQTSTATSNSITLTNWQVANVASGKNVKESKRGRKR